MKTNYYECPKCAVKVDVPTYSRLISGQQTCFKDGCDQDPRDYQFKRPGDLEVNVNFNELTVEVTPIESPVEACSL